MDEEHPGVVRESRERFGVWLDAATQAAEYGLKFEHFGEQRMPTLDGAGVIYSAIETNGYPRIALTSLDGEWNEALLESQDREKFVQARRKLLQSYYPQETQEGDSERAWQIEHQWIVDQGTKASIVSVSQGDWMTWRCM